VLRDCGGDALLHFFRRGNANERDGEFVSGGAAEMHVGIIEARHQELALEIDGFDPFLAASAIRQDMVHLPDARDPSFTNG
jgi:hypothetical protein